MYLASWNFAFKNTVDAISLNRKLNFQAEDRSVIAFNPEYLNKKNKILDKVLKRYTLDSAEWRDEFWLKISRIAASKDIRGDFHPDKINNTLSSDPASVISRQSILFEGDYTNLVGLLDSVQKTEDLGFITSAVFRKVDSRQQNERGKLNLKLLFSIAEE